MKVSMIKKVTSREYMMKFFYCLDVLKEERTSLFEKAEEFMKDNEEFIINRFEELKLQNSESADAHEESPAFEDCLDKVYIRDLCNAYEKNSEEIDAVINRYANNWSTDTMPKVDVAILRVAVAEITYMDAIPDKASVNEAVEMAKLYCDDKSPKFINGILGSYLNDRK